MLPFRKTLLACTAVGTLFTGASPAARAQDQTPAGTPTRKSQGIEQVIVTARRRAENIQRVPVAVTALSSGTLRRQQVTASYDLNRVAPSLQISASAGGGQNQPEIALRGQRQGDTLASVDPSVGVYLGDALIWRPFGFSQSFFDLSNVQVLKGPQGTLFGRNTTGGNILLQPNLPTNQYDAMLHTSIGDYNLHEFDGFVNLPISDKVQLRVAAQHEDRLGYIKDLTTGKDDGNIDESAVRVSLRLKPADGLENVTVGNWIDSANNGSGYKLGTIFPNTVASAVYGAFPGNYLNNILARQKQLGFYQIATDGVFNGGYASSHVVTLANTTTYQISDTLNFKNIISYDHYTVAQADQFTGSALPLLAYANTEGGDQFTEEFQVYGHTKRLNYIGGIYYFREQAFDQSFTPEEINPLLIGYIIPQKIPDHDLNQSASIFGQATYDFSDYVRGVSVTFGGRETYDKRNANFGTLYSLGIPPGTPTQLGFPSPGPRCAFSGSAALFQPYPSCRTQQHAEFNKFTYNVALDYQIAPGQLLYFAHRLGYRTGGFGTRAVNELEVAPFAPETVNDYEVGAKFDWQLPGGMFLRTNGAVFQQDYVNIQRLVTLVIGGATSTDLINAASASINGAELEVTFLPTDWLRFDGFISQVQPKYNKFVIPASLSNIGQPIDVTKTATFSGFPRTSFGLTARLTLPVPERYGQAVLQGNYYHQSAYIQQDSSAAEAQGSTPGYGIVNLRVEWNGVYQTKFDLAAFVNNVADNHYLAANFSLANEIGFVSTLAAPPRMFGFEGTYHFGL